MMGGEHQSEFYVNLEALRARVGGTVSGDLVTLVEFGEAGTPLRVVPGSELNGAQRPSVMVVPARHQSRAQPVRILQELLLTRQQLREREGERRAAVRSQRRRDAADIGTAFAEPSALES